MMYLFVRFSDAMPKVRMPKKGWFRITKKRIFRGASVKASENGLPPCPACNLWTMQRDNKRNELYCGSCGAIL